jgi:hypothetical protein
MGTCNSDGGSTSSRRGARIGDQALTKKLMSAKESYENYTLVVDTRPMEEWPTIVLVSKIFID